MSSVNEKIKYRSTVEEMLSDLREGKVSICLQTPATFSCTDKDDTPVSRASEASEGAAEIERDSTEKSKDCADSSDATTPKESGDPETDVRVIADETDSLQIVEVKVLEDTVKADTPMDLPIPTSSIKFSRPKATARKSFPHSMKVTESPPVIVELRDDVVGKAEGDGGDPNRAPGVGATAHIDPAYLEAFRFGWKREAVQRHGALRTRYDVYYWPPTDSPYRGNQAKRKRRSRIDQEKYFQEFPCASLSSSNFNYVNRPLGLNNSVYEIVRISHESNRTSVSKKEKVVQDDSLGLLDNGSVYKDGFNLNIPLSLQLQETPITFPRQKRKREEEEEPTLNVDVDPLAVFQMRGEERSLSRPGLGRPDAASKATVGKILSTGEIIGQMSIVTPCTPYCPGASGFPELECNSCQALFHSKCVGVAKSDVEKEKVLFMCKTCKSTYKIDLPEVIDLC